MIISVGVIWIFYCCVSWLFGLFIVGSVSFFLVSYFFSVMLLLECRVIVSILLLFVVSDVIDGVV